MIRVFFLLLALLLNAWGSAGIGFAQTSSVEKKSAIVVVPSGWESAVEAWSTYRVSQGFDIEVVSARATEEETKTLLKSTVRKNKWHAPFILLAADTMPINQLHVLESGEPFVPTFYLPSEAIVQFGGEPEIATDYPYGDLDDDGVAECAVGRIPANDAEQLKRMLQRTIAYEQETNRGIWQYEMNMTAGVGGFSMLADMAISSFAKALLTKSLPAQFQLMMTHASDTSPYFPPASKFRDTVVNQLNRSGMLWVYMGHGNVQRLDSIRHNNQLYPILTNDDVELLEPSGPGSLALLLACYSGATDAPGPCLAEHMLRQQKGPIVAIAASRVSMPYGMSVIAKEMLHEAFELRTPTIGEILRNAKREVAHFEDKLEEASDDSMDQLMASMASALSPGDHDLSQERQEHLWLMNLLGDPTLQLPQSEELPFEYKLTEDNRLYVEGTSTFPGELDIQVQYDRGRIPKLAMELMTKEQRAKKAKQEIDDETALGRYAAANQLSIAGDFKAIGKGRFVATIPLPDDARGKFIVRCTVYNQNRSAVGAQPISLGR